MGIVNTTPDSFSDGGQFLQSEAAITHALRLVNQGADILDVGGESTRPGAASVSEQQELDRIMPVIEGLRQATETPISIDTSKVEVMAAALSAGASMVNDVNALQKPGALDLVAKEQVPVCLMHMLASPKTMQQAPKYANVVTEVIKFLQQRITHCVSAGIDQRAIIVDPGIGFGKSLAHNLSLLKALPLLCKQLQCEVLVGVSRKSMINDLFDRAIAERLPASLGLAVQAVLNGAKIVRVHDVQATHDAVRSIEAVLQAET